MSKPNRQVEKWLEEQQRQLHLVVTQRIKESQKSKTGMFEIWEDNSWGLRQPLSSRFYVAQTTLCATVEVSPKVARKIGVKRTKDLIAEGLADSFSRMFVKTLKDPDSFKV